MLGDQPYHLIAFEAYIDNPNVMHHLAALACDDSGEWCCAVVEKVTLKNEHHVRFTFLDCDAIQIDSV